MLIASVSGLGLFLALIITVIWCVLMTLGVWVYKSMLLCGMIVTPTIVFGVYVIAISIAWLLLSCALIFSGNSGA